MKEEFFFTHLHLINTLREADPHRYKLACDLVKDSIVTEQSDHVIGLLSVKLSQRHNIAPEIAKVYIDAAMWAMVNNYLFDKIRCHTCNDTRFIQIGPHIRGMKKCPDCGE